MTPALGRPGGEYKPHALFLGSHQGCFGLGGDLFLGVGQGPVDVEGEEFVTHGNSSSCINLSEIVEKQVFRANYIAPACLPTVDTCRYQGIFSPYMPPEKMLNLILVRIETSIFYFCRTFSISRLWFTRFLFLLYGIFFPPSIRHLPERDCEKDRKMV